jgi:hypothetical protein
MAGEKEQADSAWILGEGLAEGDQRLVHLLFRGVLEELHGEAQLFQGSGQVACVVDGICEGRHAFVSAVSDDEGVTPARCCIGEKAWGGEGGREKHHADAPQHYAYRHVHAPPRQFYSLGPWRQCLCRWHFRSIPSVLQILWTPQLIVSRPQGFGSLGAGYIVPPPNFIPL